ncbi:MAG: pyruvate, water dikinase [Deltaproteobacteria bacterium]|nr:pyruvate, water dikinase [Deltaproteobacteria bacterium]
MGGSLRRWWRKLLGRPEPLTELEAEQLAQLFRRRYHDFRLLLAANNKALKRIAEMEVAAGGEQVFGVSFTRARSTQVLVSVLRMVRHLEGLAPDRFAALPERVTAIEEAIQDVLAEPSERASGDWVVDLDDLAGDGLAQAGGKMANLARVRSQAELAVPAGFVVTADGYRRFLAHNDLADEIARLLQTTEGDDPEQLYTVSSQIRQRIVAGEIPEDLAQAIDGAYRQLESRSCPDVRVAMRSSAAGEDGAAHSFAGQYRSTLNVDHEGLLEVYREILASAYSPPAMEYRYRRGLRAQDLPMSVGCLAMVEARAGGVAYTGDPIDAEDHRIHISATWGLPGAVVEGRGQADHYVVERDEPWAIVERHTRHKGAELRCHAELGVEWESVADERAEAACLTDEQLVAIARAAERLEAVFGAPQDVEWATNQAGELVILQSRPLRQVSAPTRLAAPEIDAEPLLIGGVRVSPGVATGPLCWMNREADALTYPEGAVLALEVPAPRWAALLSRAPGVVAVHGDVAGHLATVARELGKPALFGLGESLRALTTGTEVTLDADGQAVYPGRIEPLLDGANRAPTHPMAGSPVQQQLLAVLEHIAPLTMLDPDSSDFRAQNCQTLHDVTRFCHEMAVREVFAFGKQTRLARHASKQLYYQVPMQWWILDLEDAFREPVTGKYVKLDNIQSGPMLSVWKGMTAIPWEGPPRMSGKGMASVMFEATRNPGLASPYRKPHAHQNYFMISKDFLNLQSRFGFHFTSVEALMSERVMENYLRFGFKGGAADEQRRLARVELIADLLEGRGFETEVTGDALIARVTGAEPAAIGRRLEVIGYLLMHTRQLDMIMGEPKRVRRYRAKLERDMDSLRDAVAPTD